jgi:LmbE family N-acetylglucosaminyl deacetylase
VQYPALVFLALLVVACAPASAVRPAVARVGTTPIAPPSGVWVLAPHPDDETLMTGGVIARALASHRELHVILMTNGDYTCSRDGAVRQAETVAAMERLGVPESRVRFLGYPDGYLDSLGVGPLEVARRTDDGGCGTGDRTYATRGERGADVHSARTGEPGTYEAASVVDDLVALLEHDVPTDVFVSHGIDDHPDHAWTWVYLRRALERAHLPWLPTLHRSIVHAGPCWPNGSVERGPCPVLTHGGHLPPLPGLLARYRPTEVFSYPHGAPPKLDLVSVYRSQLDALRAEEDWLSAFVRDEEVFWVETLTSDPLDRSLLVRSPADGAPPATIARTSAQIGAPISLEVRAGVSVYGDADHRSFIVRANDLIVRRIRVGSDGREVHELEVRADSRPDDGGVLELTLRLEGEIIGLAVVPDPASVAASTGTTLE